MKWWWLCPAIVIAVGGAIIYVRLLEALWDEAAAWQKAWTATEPPEVWVFTPEPAQGNETPDTFIMRANSKPHWRRNGP